MTKTFLEKGRKNKNCLVSSKGTELIFYLKMVFETHFIFFILYLILITKHLDYVIELWFSLYSNSIKFCGKYFTANIA